MNWEPFDSGVEAVSQRPRWNSFFMGGFECSTHRIRAGRRLDLVAASRHDVFAQQDYQRLHEQGLHVAREGMRWHLVEKSSGQYDFSSALPIVHAARATRTQVIWDLCHFGWPDHLDLFKPEFVRALCRYAGAFAEWLHRETGEPGFFVPVNEISFFSWAAGEEGAMYPFATGRGFELKTQLVRAAIESMEAIWAVSPQARFVHVDPVIHVIAEPDRWHEKDQAEAYRLTQFQAWDMLSGRVWPELGGHEKYLDIIGVNFYPHNQWFYNLKGFRRIRRLQPLSRRHPLYRPFRDMLAEVYRRYHRPMLIAETGAEDRARASWLRYICSETNSAINAGVPIHGLRLYPILNHPGWEDDRHCYNALWDYADERGNREIYTPLAKELGRWQKFFEKTGSVGNVKTEREKESVGA